MQLDSYVTSSSLRASEMPVLRHFHQPAMEAVTSSLVSARYDAQQNLTYRRSIAPITHAWIKMDSGAVSDVIRHEKCRSYFCSHSEQEWRKTTALLLVNILDLT